MLSADPVLIPLSARVPRTQAGAGGPKPAASSPRPPTPSASPQPPSKQPRAAQVLDLSALRRQQEADVVKLRLAARSLAESARQLTAYAESTRASAQRLGEHRATLVAQGERGRRIAAQAEAIEAAILRGDLDAMLALQQRLTGPDAG